ncbi:hypothetical protein [Hahella sp. CCB-MM4]|nr:hypothetical protein [Hahella sp. CCB-MM4]
MNTLSALINNKINHSAAAEGVVASGAYFSGWHFWFYFFRTFKRAA